MSILSGRKAYLPLEENKEYKVSIIGYSIKESSDPTPENLGFVTFKYEIIKDGQPITDNRSVPSGTDILARQLIMQLGLTNGVDQEELFNKCVSEGTPLSMWVTKRELNGITYSNPTFAKPQLKTASPIQQPVDDSAPFK